MFTIHAIIASHNRRQLTLQCIDRLIQAAEGDSYQVSVFLFDDGSSDGTAQAVKQLLPSAIIMHGSGSAFWAASMAAAEAAVLAEPTVQDTDYILWLNDDVLLDLDALDRLAGSPPVNHESIVVGAVRDPESGELTYSGLRKTGLHPLSYGRVIPDERNRVPVDSFNGNVVLVPVTLARKLVGIEGRYAHAFADIDYGIRARQDGATIWLTPGTVGTCAINAKGPRQKILADWSEFIGTKGGGHFASLSRILKRTHPVIWPAYILATYCLWWTRQVTSRILKR